jgi:hypothetical protein
VGDHPFPKPSAITGEHPFPIQPAKAAGEHPFSMITEQLEHVPWIRSIDVEIEKSVPPNLVVRVVGETPTSGWTLSVLLRRIHVQPPPDGFWEYDFLALRPTFGADVMTPIEASNRWNEYDEKHVKGVRVFGVGKGVMQKPL